MRKVMEPDWETKLLEASVRDSGEQEKRFLSLVDQAAGNIDLRIAKVLMRTYSAKPDFGTQERVESVMATADPKIVVQAVMEEMPRLVSGFTSEYQDTFGYLVRVYDGPHGRAVDWAKVREGAINATNRRS